MEHLQSPENKRLKMAVSESLFPEIQIETEFMKLEPLSVNSNEADGASVQYAPSNASPLTLSPKLKEPKTAGLLNADNLSPITGYENWR